jgi:hypothetical protein
VVAKPGRCDPLSVYLRGFSHSFRPPAGRLIETGMPGHRGIGQATRRGEFLLPYPWKSCGRTGA